MSAEPPDTPEPSSDGDASGEPEPGKSSKLTRRAFVGGGAVLGAGVLLGGLQFGPTLIGSSFERHLAEVLGVPVDVATSLAANARGRMGESVYAARSAAFLAATEAPGRPIMPDRAREEAIRPFLLAVFGDAADRNTYLGLRPPGPTTACSGLLRETAV